MIFIETPIFTKRLRELLSDDSYAAFQRQLAERPDMGDVIEGTGGIRKVRVASSGHGKRAGPGSSTTTSRPLHRLHCC